MTSRVEFALEIVLAAVCQRDDVFVVALRLLRSAIALHFTDDVYILIAAGFVSRIISSSRESRRKQKKEAKRF